MYSAATAKRPKSSGRRPGDPSLSEIAERAAEVQSTWPLEIERLRRAGNDLGVAKQLQQHWTPPVVSLADLTGLDVDEAWTWDT